MEQIPQPDVDVGDGLFSIAGDEEVAVGHAAAAALADTPHRRAGRTAAPGRR
jgi:hypothetical protein